MIETERLILKPVTNADIAIYQKIMSCPKMSLYLPKGAPYDEQEIALHLQQRVAHWQHGFGAFMVSLKSAASDIIGYAAVEISSNPDCSDIRYGFRADAQGKGYAYEAAKAVLDYTFSLEKHTTIYGVAVKENIPSINLLKKLGMESDDSVVIYDDEKLVTLSVHNKGSK